MRTDDTLCGVLRHLFTWPDRVLVRDSSSALEGIPAWLDGDALAELVGRYLELRRKAPNWNPKRYDQNNHPFIDREAVIALLLDAKRKDEDATPLKKPRRTGRPRVRCVVCRTRFAAERSTARYCSEACKQKAKRGRRSGAQETGGPNHHDTLRVQEGPSDGPDPGSAA